MSQLVLFGLIFERSPYNRVAFRYEIPWLAATWWNSLRSCVMFTSVLGYGRNHEPRVVLVAWDHVAIVNTTALWAFMCFSVLIMYLYNILWQNTLLKRTNISNYTFCMSDKATAYVARSQKRDFPLPVLCFHCAVRRSYVLCNNSRAICMEFPVHQLHTALINHK